MDFRVWVFYSLFGYVLCLIPDTKVQDNLSYQLNFNHHHKSKEHPGITRSWFSDDGDSRLSWPNKYKIAGDIACCCKTSTIPREYTKTHHIIFFTFYDDPINCTEKMDSSFKGDANCYCHLNLNNTNVEKNCTSSIPHSSPMNYIYIGAAAVILLTTLVTCRILFLTKKTGFKIDKYSLFRPSSNRKRITIGSKSFAGNSNVIFAENLDNIQDQGITDIKYGYLLNKRESSHIYYSLDNIHIAAQEPAPGRKEEKRIKNLNLKIFKRNSMKFAKISRRRTNITKTRTTIFSTASCGDDVEINKRGPLPLPHENVQPANNATNLFLPPLQNKLRTAPPPPVRANKSAMELSNVFKTQGVSAYVPMAKLKSPLTPPRFPPVTSRKPDRSVVPVRSSSLDHSNANDYDWTYEQFLNVSIYNV